jgi:VanZ family protein
MTQTQVKKRIQIPELIFSFWIPVILWAVLIFYFSSEALPATSRFYWKDFVVKKTAHVVEYFVFAALLYRAMVNSGLNKKKSGIYTVIFCIAYALTDEYHQSFTPGREPKLRDVVFDTIGASLAIYYLWKLLPKAPKKLKLWAEKLQLN